MLRFRKRKRCESFEGRRPVSGRCGCAAQHSEIDGILAHVQKGRIADVERDWDHQRRRARAGNGQSDITAANLRRREAGGVDRYYDLVLGLRRW